MIVRIIRFMKVCKINCVCQVLKLKGEEPQSVQQKQLTVHTTSWQSAQTTDIHIKHMQLPVHSVQVTVLQLI